MEEIQQKIEELSQKFETFQETVLSRLNDLEEKVDHLSTCTEDSGGKKYHQCACCFNSKSDEETRYCPGCGYYYCYLHWDSYESHFLGGICNVEKHPAWDCASTFEPSS